MISHERRCIFVHIPKCAGSSVEDVLWPGPRSPRDLWMGFVDTYHNAYQTGGLQHLTARLVRDVVGPEVFFAYYRFAVIRNPYDRAVSQYEFMKRRPDLRTFLGMGEREEFKRYLERIAARSHVQWEAQYRFVYGEDDELLVNDVLRFERLSQDIARPFSRLGIEAELPHVKKGAREAIASYYDSEAREMVGALYAEDLRRFGYTFPD